MRRLGKRPRIEAVLSASDRFGKFAPEVHQDVRELAVDRTRDLQYIIRAWEKFMRYCMPSSKGEKFESHYHAAASYIENLRYSARDVEMFSIVLSEYQHENIMYLVAGTFISALINRGNETDYVVHTRHLGRSIWSLGMDNTKRIIVDGSVEMGAANEMRSGSMLIRDYGGHGLGGSMKGGSIIVEGDAGGQIGTCMSGGSITVKGSAKDYVGQCMRGGTIIIEGDVGEHLASQMERGLLIVKGNSKGRMFPITGGEVHVEGKFGGFEQLRDYDGYYGKVYNKGKLIRPKEGGGK